MTRNKRVRSLGAILPLALCAWAILTVGGCAAGLDAQMSSRTVDADAQTAFAAAQTVLRRDFDHLVIDRKSLRIATQPQEYTSQSDSGTARDWVKGRSNMRRTATLTVAAVNDRTASVRVRIDREREDVTQRESYAQPSRLSDSPAHTPIERDAATTKRQNAAWVAIGRDSRLEREILTELERTFSRNSPAAAPEANPAPAQASDPEPASNGTE